MWFITPHEKNAYLNKFLSRIATQDNITITNLNPYANTFEVEFYSAIVLLSYIFMTRKEKEELEKKQEKEREDNISKSYEETKEKNDIYIMKILEYKRFIFSLYNIIDDMDKSITNYMDTSITNYNILNNVVIMENLQKMNLLLNRYINNPKTIIPKNFLYYIIKELFVHLLPTFPKSSVDSFYFIDMRDEEYNSSEMKNNIQNFLLGFLNQVSVYDQINQHRNQLQKFTIKMKDLIGIIILS